MFIGRTGAEAETPIMMENHIPTMNISVEDMTGSTVTLIEP